MSTELTHTDEQVKPNHHNALCSVCKHPQVNELERRFMLYESQAQLARDYELQEKAVSRHIRYLHLDEKRGAQMEKMLTIMLSRGFDKGLKVDNKLWVECAKEFNRVTGKRQKDGENQPDLARAKQLLNELREEYGRTPERPDGAEDGELVEMVVKKCEKAGLGVTVHDLIG